MITSELALRIREHGLRLPVSLEYEDQAVAVLAQRQKELHEELDALDRQLRVRVMAQEKHPS